MDERDELGQPPRTEDLVGELAPAKKAWKRYKANRDHDIHAVYPYLEIVYVLVRRWKKQGVAKRKSLEALKARKRPIRMKDEPYARVICCTSDADPKARSKWALIMRLLERRKATPVFTDNVIRNGGLNKCAKLARDCFGRR